MSILLFPKLILILLIISNINSQLELCSSYYIDGTTDPPTSRLTSPNDCLLFTDDSIDCCFNKDTLACEPLIKGSSPGSNYICSYDFFYIVENPFSTEGYFTVCEYEYKSENGETERKGEFKAKGKFDLEYEDGGLKIKCTDAKYYTKIYLTLILSIFLLLA